MTLSRWLGFGAGEAGALVQSFWHGPVLTPYERLSIKSFIDCGHRFRLYTYDLRLDVPDGCEVADAAAILPEDRVFFYPGDRGRGSVAAFANLFRYKLLHDRGGWWVDTDIVCQARRLPGARYVFGYQSDGSINNAVLKCPAGSRLMQRCHEAAAAEGEDLRWGVTGPLLLSRLVIEQRLERFVADSRAFYPYDWREACLPLDPDFTARIEHACAGSTFVHLWNETLNRAGVDKTVPPPPGSYLAGLFARHGISFES